MICHRRSIRSWPACSISAARLLPPPSTGSGSPSSPPRRLQEEPWKRRSPPRPSPGTSCRISSTCTSPVLCLALCCFVDSVTKQDRKKKVARICCTRYGSCATARDFEIYAAHATFEDPLMRAHGYVYDLFPHHRSIISLLLFHSFFHSRVKQIKSAFYTLPKVTSIISVQFHLHTTRTYFKLNSL